MPPAHFALVLEMGVSQIICLGWPQTLILLFLASQVARVTAMSMAFPHASITFLVISQKLREDCSFSDL
jgi:hypothetical protein